MAVGGVGDYGEEVGGEGVVVDVRGSGVEFFFQNYFQKFLFFQNFPSIQSLSVLKTIQSSHPTSIRQTP